MHPLVEEIIAAHSPESLVENLRGARGIVLLRTSAFDSPAARYSFVTADPFLTLRSRGSQCELRFVGGTQLHFGNPWQMMDALMSRFELLDEIDLPFPLGGCFGFWGYDLKNFTEPKLPRRAVCDLELPDCHLGFYDSLVVFDHQLGKIFIVSTGLNADGSRGEPRASERVEFWRQRLRNGPESVPEKSRSVSTLQGAGLPQYAKAWTPDGGDPFGSGPVVSNIGRDDFLSAVARSQGYIRAGHIYQVNLSQRLTASGHLSGWELFQKLNAVSPAPYSAFLDCDDHQIVSTSPEQFLRMSGSHITSRPIKGTRPRGLDATRDAQLAYELQTSPKELAELVMITDLLRNDLGKVCEFGSVRVPDLAKLEKFAQVQHLVSTVEGRLRPGLTHFAALASCFPGGSITGAPKFRAMEIIDELEPVSRGPYCGCHGYLGFNRESQLSITIRTAICAAGRIHFNVGAGIVADSNPEAEYDETLAKARGFFEAWHLQPRPMPQTVPSNDHFSQR